MKRHGFATVWLFVILFCNAICAICLTSVNSDYWYLLRYSRGIGITYLIALLCLINCAGAILLLNWKNYGFWIILCSDIIEFFVQISSGTNIFGSLLISFLPILILYTVLKLENNGVSAWDYLNDGCDYVDYTKDKKCRRCGTIYSSTESTCFNCGSSLFHEVESIRDLRSYSSSTTPSNYSIRDTWICKRCNKRNLASAIQCDMCGEYK